MSEFEKHGFTFILRGIRRSDYGFTATVLIPGSTARLYGRGRSKTDALASAERMAESWLATARQERWVA